MSSQRQGRLQHRPRIADVVGLAGEAAATRVLVLHHGAAIAEGPPADVVREPAVVQSYLGAEAL